MRKWAELQAGQRILVTTPSVVVGYRCQVYRSEGATQWYTAVIVGLDEETGVCHQNSRTVTFIATILLFIFVFSCGCYWRHQELTLTDDTVLEEHYEDPRLLQIKLLGEGGLNIYYYCYSLPPKRSHFTTSCFEFMFSCWIHLERWNSRHHIQTLESFISGKTDDWIAF